MTFEKYYPDDWAKEDDIIETAKKSKEAGMVSGWHWPWINVKDKLPDDGIEVLIFDGCDIYLAAHSDFGDDHYWHQNGVKCYYTKYWMPVPEPPEKDNEK